MEGTSDRRDRLRRAGRREIATIEREQFLTPAAVGLTIEEGKIITEALQRSIVTAQVKQHGASMSSCLSCGAASRTKGYYSSTVLTDGAANLRAMQRRIAPAAEHVLEWFHVGMRFEQLKQVAKGISDLNNGGLRSRA